MVWPFLTKILHHSILLSSFYQTFISPISNLLGYRLTQCFSPSNSGRNLRWRLLEGSFYNQSVVVRTEKVSKFGHAPVIDPSVSCFRCAPYSCTQLVRLGGTVVVVVATEGGGLEGRGIERLRYVAKPAASHYLCLHDDEMF